MRTLAVILLALLVSAPVFAGEDPLPPTQPEIICVNMPPVWQYWCFGGPPVPQPPPGKKEEPTVVWPPCPVWQHCSPGAQWESPPDVQP